jgi:hypothetical protein
VAETLEVTEPVDIGFGITLTPGLYVGKCGRYWLGAQHWVELTAGEIRSLGGEPTPGVESSVYDVTKYVRLGKIVAF